MRPTSERVARPRPFPWPCPNCLTLTIFPAIMDYSATFKHDGVVQVLSIPSLEVPCCQNCGETIITDAVDERINEAIRSHLGLPAPGS